MPAQNDHLANGHEGDYSREHSRASVHNPNGAHSVGAGLKPAHNPETTIYALDAFEVSYEPVTAQDLNALANMLDLAVKNGWASAQTAAEKLGFDPAVEQERMGGHQPSAVSDPPEKKA